MSWNGTVRCSECYNTGHNKNGCPRRKERYEAALAMSEEERGYGERRLIEQMERKQQRSSTRKCAYCSNEGHNRRTCETLKAHIGHVHKQEVAFRAAFAKHVKEIGLGVGALVSQADEHSRYAPRLAMVTKLQWEGISICSAQNSIDRFGFAQPVANMNNPNAAQTFTIRAPEHWNTGENWKATDYRYHEQTYGVKVSSPVPGEDPPSGWIDDDSAVKAWFKESERQAYMWPTEDNQNGYGSCEWWNLEDNQEVKEIA